MEHHDILRTLAEVATAFAGFTGIVVVIGGRARGNLIALLVILASSLGVVFFGFVPDLALAAHLEPSQAWRLSTFLFATYHLVVIFSSLLGPFALGLHGVRVTSEHREGEHHHHYPEPGKPDRSDH